MSVPPRDHDEAEPDYGEELELALPPRRASPGTVAPENGAGLSPPAQQDAAHVPIRPIPAPVRGGGGAWVARLLILGLLGVGAYGGAYGYCTYKLTEKIQTFDQEIQDIRQRLLAMNKTIRPVDVAQVVIDAAQKIQVELHPADVLATIEPLNTQSQKKLAGITQGALNIVAGIPRYRGPQWVIGFKARLHSSYGLAKKTWVAERYTWFDDAQP
jgi:hypothetical protein